MKRSVIVCLVALTLVGMGAYAMPSLNWGSDSFSGDPTLNDNLGAALTGSKGDPTVGCFIQLIWDSGFDGLDPIDLGQSDGAADDDTVLGWSYIGWNTGFGPANGYVWQAGTDTSALSTNDRIYMRTWDAPADSAGDFTAGNIPSTATFYGDSDEFFTVPDTPVAQDWHVGDFGSTGWDTTIPVPEPGTLALFALGLLTVGLRRRKK